MGWGHGAALRKPIAILAGRVTGAPPPLPNLAAPTLPPAVTVRFPLMLFGVPHQVGPLAFRTAGDAIDLPFDLTIESLQRWTLVYLGLSSLVFVLVWVLGYLRR